MQKALSISNIPDVTIRVSGKLFQGHLSYLDQLVQTAGACELWVLLDLENLEEVDRAVISCPNFVREWMTHESRRIA